MVPAVPTYGYPDTWPTDGRDGGVPDPTLAGPAFYQIGSEGGMIPQVAVITPNPVNYDYNRKSVTITNVTDKGLYMGPAERADVIIDFSQYAGKTLIVYNDAPAPMPAFDARYDYYTGDLDHNRQRRRPHHPPRPRAQHPDHHAISGSGGNSRAIYISRRPGSRNAGGLRRLATPAHCAGNLLSTALSGGHRYVWVCPIPKLDLYPTRFSHPAKNTAGDEGHYRAV